MASSACAAHGTAHNGRLYGVYPALIIDGKRLSSKRKYCADAMYQMLADHKKEWDDSAFESPDSPETSCHGCGEQAESIGELRPFFLTCYVDGKHRRDYRARYCEQCAEQLRVEFDLHG
jgi:hypothetical protein